MRLEYFAVMLAALSLTACPGKMDAARPDAGDPYNYETQSDGGFARSKKGNLRFKGPDRFAADLGIALLLESNVVCNELGQYACTSTVHAVALGGVDPYLHSVYEPSTLTGSTTPVIVERVVLSACTARVERDFAAPGAAVVFKGLEVGADGALVNPESESVKAVITELARRAWLREPRDEEVTELVKLAKDIGTAKAWAQAACFVAFSSAEAVFY